MLRTLESFIEEQMTNYKIPDTNKNRKKLRAKFRRELIKLNLWNNAREEIKGRNRTKVFTKNELDQLKINTHNYLLKRGNIDIDQFTRYINRENHTTKNESKIYKITQSDINQLMLRAIFEKFYEPEINIKKWEDDIGLNIILDEHDSPIERFHVHERLKNPVKSYTKTKEK